MRYSSVPMATKQYACSCRGLRRGVSSGQTLPASAATWSHIWMDLGALQGQTVRVRWSWIARPAVVAGSWWMGSVWALQCRGCGGSSQLCFTVEGRGRRSFSLRHRAIGPRLSVGTSEAVCVDSFPAVMATLAERLMPYDLYERHAAVSQLLRTRLGDAAQVRILDVGGQS